MTEHRGCAWILVLAGLCWALIFAVAAVIVSR
jgi:hypothetical protein